MTHRRRPRSKWFAYVRPDGSFDFEALTDAQKERLYHECEALGEDDKGEPLTASQRQLHALARRSPPQFFKS